MKVVVNARWLLPGKLEGTGVFTLRMLEEITRALPDVDFTLLYDRPSAAKQPLIQGKNIKHRVVYPPARHPLLWQIWNRWSVPRALWKEQADLYWSPDGLPARTSAPQWITIHDLNFIHHPEWLPKRVAKHYKREVTKATTEADLLFTVSQWSKEDIVHTFGVEASYILVTPNATSEKFRLGPARRQPYFCAVGAMTPRKNLKTLLRAFDLFASSDSNEGYVLKIAGEPHFKDAELDRTYQEMRYKDRVKFIGRISTKELEELYQNATAFCMPSAMEGFGIPVLEAMQCGTTVISSDNSALSEVVGDAGILVPTYKVNAWAEAMEQAKAQTGKWSKKGMAQVSKYDWSKSAQIFIDQFKKDFQ